MESNVDGSSEPKSGCSSDAKQERTDVFNMRNCADALPEHLKKGSQEAEDTDDEKYSDAKDRHSDDESDEELSLEEEEIAKKHKDLNEDYLQKYKDEAAVLKNTGNTCYKKGEYKDAISFYTIALNTCPLKYDVDRSILFANRAAARISIDKKEEAVLDCNKAIELNPTYLKALIRRAQLHRKMDSLEKSLEDYQKILELDRNNAEARCACSVLPKEIEEKNEKLKDEMFGKLKDLGNICLKPFGLSTENFKVVQDPSSGGYSINFQNNKS